MVTFEGPSAARAYAEDTGIGFPILVDETRTLYRAYGVGTAKLRHLIGPTTLRAYWREARRGVWPRAPVSDPTQQGGDVLIDPDGIVRFHHVGAGSGYRPALSAILDAVR